MRRARTALAMTCPSCHTAVQAEHRFCPACGAALQAAPSPPAARRTGVEQLASDSQLQSHWVRRLVALIIDGVVVAVALAIVFFALIAPYAVTAFFAHLGPGFPDFPFFLFPPFTGFVAFPLAAGVLYLLYFAFAESWYGMTVGKRVMGLRVETISGQPVGLDKAFIRNLSKLHWILLLLDVAVGLATPGDPRQKFSDRFAGTRVASTR